MFDDPRKELRRLEEQLLAEEDPGPDVPEDALWLDDELEEARRLLGDEMPDDEEEEDEDPEPMVYRNFANGYGRRQSAPVRNRDRFDRDLEEYNQFFDAGTVRVAAVTTGTEGVKSYGPVCDLLVSWHIQEVVLPSIAVEETPFDPYDESQVDLSGIVNARPAETEGE